MKVSSTLPIVPLVALSPQPLEATFSDEELIPTKKMMINKDMRIIMVEDKVEYMIRVVVKDVGENMSAP